MKKNFLKILGLLLAFFGVIVPAFLAINKTISERLFGLLCLAFLAAGFLIYKIDEIVEFEIRGLKLKTLQKEIFAKAEDVEKLLKKLDEDKQELRQSIRIFIETLYLTLSSRHKFPIPKNISDEIINNLNTLARLAIKNQNEKEDWQNRMNEINKLLETEVK